MVRGGHAFEEEHLDRGAEDLGAGTGTSVVVASSEDNFVADEEVPFDFLEVELVADGDPPIVEGLLESELDARAFLDDAQAGVLRLGLTADRLGVGAPTGFRLGAKEEEVGVFLGFFPVFDFDGFVERSRFCEGQRFVPLP